MSRDHSQDAEWATVEQDFRENALIRRTSSNDTRLDESIIAFAMRFDCGARGEGACLASRSRGANERVRASRGGSDTRVEE